MDSSQQESVEMSFRQSVLSSEERSQYARLRAIVDRANLSGDQQHFIWPQARLCDFITLDNAIEHWSSALFLERSKVPFVLCDAETTEPKMVLRFKEAFTAKSFTRSSREAREFFAEQDNFLRQIGMPVALIDEQSDINAIITAAIGSCEYATQV